MNIFYLICGDSIASDFYDSDIHVYVHILFYLLAQFEITSRLLKLHCSNIEQMYLWDKTFKYANIFKIEKFQRKLRMFMVLHIRSDLNKIR